MKIPPFDTLYFLKVSQFFRVWYFPSASENIFKLFDMKFEMNSAISKLITEDNYFIENCFVIENGIVHVETLN